MARIKGSPNKNTVQSLPPKSTRNKTAMSKHAHGTDNTVEQPAPAKRMKTPTKQQRDTNNAAVNDSEQPAPAKKPKTVTKQQYKATKATIIESQQPSEVKTAGSKAK